MPERRRFPRYDCEYKVGYATEGLASLESSSTAEDISRSGVRIPVTRLVKKGDLLRLDLYGKNDDLPLPVAGRVVWTKLNRTNPRFLVDAGVEFAPTNYKEVGRFILSNQPLPGFFLDSRYSDR